MHVNFDGLSIGELLTFKTGPPCIRNLLRIDSIQKCMNIQSVLFNLTKLVASRCHLDNIC